jgi:dTDP-4-dehydrorhamnose reductase
MTILLTGAGGQLGQALQRVAAAEGVSLRALDRAALDIADPAAVARAIPGTTIVINAAAWTDVDGAEGDLLGAWRANRTGPAVLAEACKAAGAALIHLSTDYVFDGSRQRPWAEREPVNPLGAYGASKAEGEAAVRDGLDRHIILRTAWLFSATGRNFVRTMLKAAGQHEELRIVDDRFGCPTAALDLAGAVLKIAGAMAVPGHRHWGTYHYCGKPAVSWFDFARAIFAGAEKPPRLVPIKSVDWPAPAPRPAYAALDCSRLQRDFAIVQPDWRPGLDAVLAELGARRG